MAKPRALLTCLVFVSACKPTPADVSAPESSAEPVAGTAVFAEAPPIAPACKNATVSGSLGLIPEGADMVLHLSPTAISRSVLWQMLEPELAQSQDWIDIETMFRDCGMQVEGFEHLIIGVRVADEEFVAALAGQGIGRPDRAQCVVQAIQRSAGEDEAADVESAPDDPNTLIIQFTDGRAYLFEENLLVVTTTAWEYEVGQLGRCQSVGAVQRSLLDPMRGVALDAPVWVAGRPGPEIVDMLASSVSELGQLQGFSANLRLDTGMDLTARADVGDPQTAASLAGTLQGFIQMMAVGVPQGLSGVPGRMSADAVGTGVDMRAVLTADELRALGSM